MQGEKVLRNFPAAEQLSCHCAKFAHFNLHMKKEAREASNKY